VVESLKLSVSCYTTASLIGHSIIRAFRCVGLRRTVMPDHLSQNIAWVSIVVLHNPDTKDGSDSVE
jgi:hypothetical protein